MQGVVAPYIRSVSLSEAVSLLQSSPVTWESALLSNLLIFLVGIPLLVSGLSLQGIGAAFLLGTLTWRAFGPPGFLLVASYFVVGTAATKVRMAQKEAQGVAEKRKGRRGPGSVIGSSAAGCFCAFLSIYGVGGVAFSRLWKLGFVASFCTKLSDTVSSEIGKAYGKTTKLGALKAKLRKLNREELDDLFGRVAAARDDLASIQKFLLSSGSREELGPSEKVAVMKFQMLTLMEES